MKVLIIRDKTLSFNGGIKRHCDDLYALMSACDVDVMPVEDLPAVVVPIPFILEQEILPKSHRNWNCWTPCTTYPEYRLFPVR